MALFDLFKTKSSDVPQSAPALSGISLTKEDFGKKLDLRKKTLAVELEKSNISQQKARVAFVLDHSVSMRLLYQNGTVQETLERIFPLALTFDENGEMEFYLFDDFFQESEPVNNANIANYTKEVIMAKHGKYRGTSYAPVMEEIIKRYGKKEPSRIPTFVVFITDGNNCDHAKSQKALIEASHYNIFWKFVGIGKEKISFLEKLDNMRGRFIDNANFVDIHDLSKIDDTHLYHLLLEEFNIWLKLAQEKNLI